MRAVPPREPCLYGPASPCLGGGKAPERQPRGVPGGGRAGPSARTQEAGGSRSLSGVLRFPRSPRGSAGGRWEEEGAEELRGRPARWRVSARESGGRALPWEQERLPRTGGEPLPSLLQRKQLGNNTRKPVAEPRPCRAAWVGWEACACSPRTPPRRFLFVTLQPL